MMCILTENSYLIFSWEENTLFCVTCVKLVYYDWQRSCLIRYLFDSEYPNVTQMVQLLLILDYAFCPIAHHLCTHLPLVTCNKVKQCLSMGVCVLAHSFIFVHRSILCLWTKSQCILFLMIVFFWNKVHVHNEDSKLKLKWTHRYKKK